MAGSAASGVARLGRLPWILAGALVLRLWLFTGVLGIDGSIYALQAHWFPGRDPEPTFDVFAARIGHVAPLAFLFAVFGVNYVSFAAMPLAASMLTIGLTWTLGRQLGGKRLATVAALFVAVLPLNVYYATTALVDLPQAAAASLGLFLLWRAVNGNAAGYGVAVAAGCLLGVAHLMKESAFLFWIATVPWFLSRRNWRHLAIALAGFIAIVGAEMALYAVTAGEPLYRFRVTDERQVDTVVLAGGAFQARMSELLTVLFTPETGAVFFFGPLFWLVFAGAALVLVRDRSRWGWILLWLVGLILAIALWPASFNPYRPAVSLHMRFFTAITIPAALLAARFVVEVPMRVRPFVGWAGATAVALVWLLCDVVNHEEAIRWRAGAEWGHAELQRHPGALVVTDGHTMRQLQFLNAYQSPYRLRMYLTSDPPPPAGALLLDVERQVDAFTVWNSIPPPPWWRAESPAREVLGQRLVPDRFRIRRNRLPPQHITLSRVLP